LALGLVEYKKKASKKERVSKMIKNKLANKKGFMSVEAIMSMAVVLMVVVLGIGFFTYMIPRQAIEEEVHLLGRIAKMEGRLTSDDVEHFRNNMIKRGLATEDNRSEVKVEVLKESTSGEVSEKVIISEDGERVMRGEKIKINGVDSPHYAVLHVVATVPAKKEGIVGALGFFNVNSDGLSDNYVFSERIMSEYYGGES
jgi:hypothetical protein